MRVFQKIAWLGLILSLVVHILALLHADVLSGLEEFAFVLQGGAIFLGLPVILTPQRIYVGKERNDFWKEALKDCPGWMKKMIGFFVLYGIINFIYTMFIAIPKFTVTNSPEFRFFSGHWLVFYSLELGIFTSFLRSKKLVHSNAGSTIDENSNYMKIWSDSKRQKQQRLFIKIVVTAVIMVVILAALMTFGLWICREFVLFGVASFMATVIIIVAFALITHYIPMIALYIIHSVKVKRLGLTDRKEIFRRRQAFVESGCKKIVKVGTVLGVSCVALWFCVLIFVGVGAYIVENPQLKNMLEFFK